MVLRHIFGVTFLQTDNFFISISQIDGIIEVKIQMLLTAIPVIPTSPIVAYSSKCIIQVRADVQKREDA